MAICPRARCSKSGTAENGRISGRWPYDLSDERRTKARLNLSFPKFLDRRRFRFGISPMASVYPEA
jgi:hypothetical protein